MLRLSGCQFTQKTVVAQAFNPRGCYTETSCLENIKEAKKRSMGVALLVTVLGRSPLHPLRSGVQCQHLQVGS